MSLCIFFMDQPCCHFEPHCLALRQGQIWVAKNSAAIPHNVKYEGGAKNQGDNPILPAGNELVWGTVSFLVLFFLMAKFAFPAVQKSMVARTERIRSSLDAAEHSKAEAQTVLDDLHGAALHHFRNDQLAAALRRARTQRADRRSRSARRNRGSAHRWCCRAAR